MKQLDFRTEIITYLKSNQSTLKTRKANPQHWYDISCGNSKAYLSLTIDSQNKSIATGVYIPDNKELYFYLEAKKAEIELELGFQMEWLPLQNKKASRVYFKQENIDIFNPIKRVEYYEWLKVNSEKIQKIFFKYINNFEG